MKSHQVCAAVICGALAMALAGGAAPSATAQAAGLPSQPTAAMAAGAATPADLCPGAITFGQTVQCSIVTPAEADTYTFAATAGDKVLVRMSRASGNVWPGVRVYAPDASKVCEQTSGGTAEIASCTLPATGTYSILAYDSFDGTLTGNYDLYLQRSTVVAVPHLVVAGLPNPYPVGFAKNFIVSAKDASGNVATGYRGKVHFTSTDAAATLPADYTFTTADAGVHSFILTLKTLGTRSVTATDTPNSAINGTQSGIVVTVPPPTAVTVRA